MNFVGTATTVGACLLCLSPWFSAECSAKTFQLVTTSGGGGVQCAVSVASQTASVRHLPGDYLPPQVRCARHCASQTPCHSFNYRSDNYACQFYNDPPTVFQPTSNCEYFEVKTFTIPVVKLRQIAAMFIKARLRTSTRTVYDVGL